MRALCIALGLAAMAVVMPGAVAQDERDATTPKAEHERTDADKPERDAQTIAEEKKEVDQMADAAMKELFATSEKAKELHDTAYGVAVFDVVKVAIGITGGGGQGVAMAKQGAKQPMYMSMATGGIGIGLGGQKYRTIFMFETKEAFENFVFKGWQADAEANAAAGTAGANVGTTFHEGVAIFQITDKGLIANADVSGTKYWLDEELNDESVMERARQFEEMEEDRERTD